MKPIMQRQRRYSDVDKMDLRSPVGVVDRGVGGGYYRDVHDVRDVHDMYGGSSRKEGTMVSYLDNDDPLFTIYSSRTSRSSVHTILTDTAAAATATKNTPMMIGSIPPSLPSSFVCNICQDAIISAITLACGCEQSTVCAPCWNGSEDSTCRNCHAVVTSAIPCPALDQAIACLLPALCCTDDQLLWKDRYQARQLQYQQKHKQQQHKQNKELPAAFTTTNNNNNNNNGFGSPIVTSNQKLMAPSSWHAHSNPHHQRKMKRVSSPSILASAPLSSLRKSHSSSNMMSTNPRHIIVSPRIGRRNSMSATAFKQQRSFSLEGDEIKAMMSNTSNSNHTASSSGSTNHTNSTDPSFFDGDNEDADADMEQVFNMLDEECYGTSTTTPAKTDDPQTQQQKVPASTTKSQRHKRLSEESSSSSSRRRSTSSCRQNPTTVTPTTTTIMQRSTSDRNMNAAKTGNEDRRTNTALMRRSASERHLHNTVSERFGLRTHAGLMMKRSVSERHLNAELHSEHRGLRMRRSESDRHLDGQHPSSEPKSSRGRSLRAARTSVRSLSRSGITAEDSAHSSSSGSNAAKLAATTSNSSRRRRTALRGRSIPPPTEQSTKDQQLKELRMKRHGKVRDDDEGKKKKKDKKSSKQKKDPTAPQLTESIQQIWDELESYDTKSVLESPKSVSSHRLRPSAEMNELLQQLTVHRRNVNNDADAAKQSRRTTGDGTSTKPRRSKSAARTRPSRNKSATTKPSRSNSTAAANGTATRTRPSRNNSSSTNARSKRSNSTTSATAVCANTAKSTPRSKSRPKVANITGNGV